MLKKFWNSQGNDVEHKADKRKIHLFTIVNLHLISWIDKKEKKSKKNILKKHILYELNINENCI